MTEIATIPANRNVARRDDESILESVLLNGDLSKLQPGERLAYYQKVCQTLHLNPFTRPFEYITLNGKLTLYAKRDATDQIRQRDHISVTIVSREKLDDVYVVTARATTPDGRSDESIGAVNIAGLKGDALANALMKSETKAKRRVTLSIVGLGWLDETEVETVSDARPTVVDVNTGEIQEPPKAKPPKADHLTAMRTAWKKLQEDGTFLGVVIPEPDLTWTIDDWKREGQNWRAAIRQAEAESEAKAKEG